jgi:lysophospholipid acyltransferase (LPLAT)-like uncharacterized protein
MTPSLLDREKESCKLNEWKWMFNDMLHLVKTSNKHHGTRNEQSIHQVQVTKQSTIIYQVWHNSTIEK